MLIKKVAFGNFDEAFIEKKFENKVNIIFSNDNNKGKTLLIQGLMFSLGNVPIFPSGFDHNNYYFYSMVEINGETYEFLRKNKTTIVKDKSGIRIVESLSELKYLISKTLFKLPVIEKGGEDKLVDLHLFYQIFFIGQDKRNTSNIQNFGQYNKNDYLSMLRSLNGSKESTRNELDVESIRNEVKRKESEIRVINKKLKFINDNPDIASFSLKSADQNDYERNKGKLNDINENISKYRKQRARETNRKSKLENLLSELNSLNQNIEIGKVKCAECGSDRIIYTNGDMSFEISNLIVKKDIVDSINEQIEVKSETIEELTNSIQDEQDKLTGLLKEIPPKMQDYLAFSDEILSSEQYSNKILNLKAEIIALKNDLKEGSAVDVDIKEKNKLMMESILRSITKYYRSIDPDGNLIFNKLFTKSEENYSGSEEQEFYFSKLLAINNYFKHQFPIIIDSYRSGELSTSKEIKMLKEYKNINKQVILTSTLKAEEYEVLKYDTDKELNTLDYSSHENSKILSKTFKDEFKIILDSFNICENKIIR